ncbi:MAG TPA: hypothetical protein PKJ99_09660 [Thermoanaerobaculales bacterium]|nr:hypothetical protein [Thermoanaerobaculales bacterium]HQP36286.1 hypothetical protein [Polyangiaceae bacterium]
MGEYLELVTTLSNHDLGALLEQELGQHPRLLKRLQLTDGTVTTKLATCNDVFLTFDDMVALYWLIRSHHDVLRYGPTHAHNSTPEEILRDRTSLYLGPWEERGKTRKRVTVPVSLSGLIEHRNVWCPTMKTLSKNGTVYDRTIRRDETRGVSTNPAGYYAPCPKREKRFTAYEVGFAWDASTNNGRTIYQCPPCGTLFNMGERETPEYENLARALTAGYAYK